MLNNILNRKIYKNYTDFFDLIIHINIDSK